MLTRTLTKHATGKIIKNSLMMNFQAHVTIVTARIRARAVRAPSAPDPAGGPAPLHLSRHLWRIRSRTRLRGIAETPA
jgi:hypothetical protein